MDNTYEMLMGLTLFNGVTPEKMMSIVGNTKFHFLKYEPGETFIRPADPCTHLKFVISGQVRSSIANQDGRFTVSQTLAAPAVIAPEYIFGPSTFFPCEVTAIDRVGVLQIEKTDYLNILQSDPIFLFNLLNLLANRAQKTVDGVLAVATGSLEERIAFWVVALTQREGKDIVMRCRQRDLYSVFGVQRSSFIATLDSMKERGLIEYNTNEIRVTDRRQLLEKCLTHIE